MYTCIHDMSYMTNFESLDDYLVTEMMERMVTQRQFETLTNWMKTNHRFHRLGQQQLDRYRRMPPTRIGHRRTDLGSQRRTRSQL